MTQTRLKELLDYDPDTGIFVHKVRNARCIKAWSIAGWSNGNRKPYLRVMLQRKQYMLHNLAWLYVYGNFPTHQIDHINGIKDDNRIVNLREATNSQNQANKKASRNGLKGAYRSNKKWCAQISPNGKRIYLGYFKTEQEAHNAYCVAAKRFFGQYAKTA